MTANASPVRLTVTVDLVPRHHVDTPNDPTHSGTAIGLSQVSSANIIDASVPLGRRAAAHISPSVSVVPPKKNRSSMLARFGRRIGAAIGLFRRARWPVEGHMVSDVGTRMAHQQIPQSTSAHHNDGSAIIE